MPDIKTNRKHESEIDDSHSLRSFQASKRTFFKNLHSLIILPAALEVLIYEVTFLRHYDSTIISFCVRTEYSASMAQKPSLD